MSRLFPERLLVSLSPSEILSVRLRGMFRGKPVEARTVACDPAFGSEPWQGAIAALAAADRGLRATVVLSNHFVRYAIVPWSRGLDSDAEEEAYVRHHFAKIHGERAKAWALRWSANGETRLASAIDRGLLEALKQALPRLASVQPWLMAAINRWRAAIPASGAWLALVEGERACVALHQGGRWRSVQNAKGAWLDLLELERHRAGGAVPELALVAGAQPPTAPGWTFRQLQGALAH